MKETFLEELVNIFWKEKGKEDTFKSIGLMFLRKSKKNCILF